MRRELDQRLMSSCSGTALLLAADQGALLRNSPEMFSRICGSPVAAVRAPEPEQEPESMA